MIISGECRYRACLKADLQTIKANIIDADEQKIDELSLIENIQRKDLTDFEISQFIYKLWISGRYEKKKDLAAAIGKKDTYISKVLSVFNLDDEILKDIEETKPNISISVLDEIARVGDKETQKLGYEKYKAGEITRDEIKHLKAPVEKDWSKDIWEADKESVEDVKTFTGETKKIKSKTTIKETCFNNLGLDFENYISDFKIGMILHPVGTEELKIKNLKKYKMYKIIIEEI
jgi:ParB-like chromosome segregation protein Spo0J